MSEARPWHRLFGLSLMDFFRGMPVDVEFEKDLSRKVQLLDFVVVRKGAGPLTRRLPDGFGELAPHNLITFKSYRESLDLWSLQELIGHYVNYRKQAGLSVDQMPPETDFRPFVIAVRSPRDLFGQIGTTAVGPGVYDVGPYGGSIRVVVVHELPREEQNALLHLFAARTDLVEYGAEHYRQRSADTSTLMMRLFQRYGQESALMPDMLEEFVRESIDEMLRTLPPERLLEFVSPEKRLEGLSPSEMLAALSPETRAELARRLEGAGPGGRL